MGVGEQEAASPGQVAEQDNNSQRVNDPHLVGDGGSSKHEFWIPSRSMGDGHPLSRVVAFPKALLPGLRHQTVSSCASIKRLRLLRSSMGLLRGSDFTRQLVFGVLRGRKGIFHAFLCGGA